MIARPQRTRISGRCITQRSTWCRPERLAVGVSAVLAAITLLPSAPAGASRSAHVAYADALASGWQNWSWSSTVDFSDHSPFAGSRSISWRIDDAWGGLYLHTDHPVATTDATSLTFALRASASDQRLTVSLYGEHNEQLARPRRLSQLGGDPPAGSWELYEIPLTELRAAGKRISGILLQDGKGASQPVILVDEVRLLSVATATSDVHEIRPENNEANRTPGRSTDPTRFNMYESFRPYYDKINGDYVGTTEQILAWAAKKWGFDHLGYPDLAKAMAVAESWWRQGHIGANGELGILQVHPKYWPDAEPAGWSTAYAADYSMAVVRHYYDGNSWLGENTKGHIRNSVAAWECGCGSNGNGSYTTIVFEYYESKPWLRPGQPPEWF